MSTTGEIDLGPSQRVGTESSLSNWVGPYVTDMLGRAQAWSETPYQAYLGPLTAGLSSNQQNAFSGIANLTVPNTVGQAATTAGNVASAAGNLNYNQGAFANQFSAPGAYQAPSATNQFSAPDVYRAASATNQFSAPVAYQAASATNQFSGPDAYQSEITQNQFTAPDAYQASTVNSRFQTPTDMYQAGNISTDMWNNDYAQQYMTPYLQQSLDPQIQEARRQAEITRMSNAGRLAQAGAYGGSRQAIMEAENNRSMSDLMARITGEGYNRAYDTAGQLFTSDMSRDLQAQTANEQARQVAGSQSLQAADMTARYGQLADQMNQADRQFGYGQQMTAAENAARYGLSAAQMNQADRQFGYGQQMSAAENAARYGQLADQMNESSRQFGYGQQMSAAENAARYGLSADQLNESSRQFGYGQQMSAADNAARYGLSADQMNQADRQFGYGQQMTAADNAARYGLSADQMNQSENQFGANYGLQALAQQLEAAKTQGAMGTTQFQNELNRLQEMERMGGVERDTTNQGIQADYAQFQQERDDPYNKLLGMQNFLQGMPLEAQASVFSDPSFLAQIMGGIGGGGSIGDAIGGIFDLFGDDES